jgi:hypothetical protein
MAGRAARGVVAEGSFSDPDNARIIYLTVAGLLLLALALAVGTWWWWRNNKVEHPALGPLEMMGTRTWQKSDFNARAKRLEASRPANAIHEAEPMRDELDLDVLGRLEPAQFDDFSDLLPVAPAEAAVVAESGVVDAVEPGADAVAAEPELEAVVEAAAEPVVEAEPVVQAEPVVEAEPVAEPERVKRGVIVIDTAPPEPAALQLAFAEPADLDGEDDDHFDPLLRSNTSE